MAAIQSQTFQPGFSFTAPPLVRRLAALLARQMEALSGLGASPQSAARKRAIEAADVREMAYRLQRTDPSYAADLIAAADRHELGE